MLLDHHAMKRSLFLAAAVMLVPSATFASAASTAKSAITAIYKKQDAAIAKKDADGLLATYGPEYVEAHHEKNSNNMVVTREQLAPMLKRGFSVSGSVKRTLTVTAFSLEGTRAHVGIKTWLIVADSPQRVASPMQVVQSETATDTWEKTPKGWRLIRTDITDGKSEAKPLKTATAGKH